MSQKDKMKQKRTFIIFLLLLASLNGCSYNHQENNVYNGSSVVNTTEATTEAALEADVSLMPKNKANDQI